MFISATIALILGAIILAPATADVLRQRRSRALARRPVSRDTWVRPAERATIILAPR